MAGGARAPGATDTVHVVFGHVGQLEVHHLRQLVDVQPARGDVGGDQHRQRAVLELRQRTGARGLALVAVDGGRVDAVLGQVLGELVGAMLGAGEHQRLEPLLFLDQVGEQLALLLLADHVDGLVDALGGGVARRHLDRGRVVQQALGELADLVGEGGREQQVLALLRQQCEHLADVADEAHVEHAVGFVQHQELDAREVERALADVVEQAARGGDEDVHALLQRADLRVDVDAAEHHQRSERQMLAVGLHRFFHLGGELARGGEDQAARAAGRVRVGVGRSQHVQQRQREAGGLAGAGLRGGEQVAAGEHLGNGLGLDGRGVGVPRLVDRTQDGFGQPEAGEVCLGIHSMVRREPAACIDATPIRAAGGIRAAWGRTDRCRKRRG